MVEETRIRNVIVASHSGRTALEFTKKLSGKAGVFRVSPNSSKVLSVVGNKDLY